MNSNGSVTGAHEQLFRELVREYSARMYRTAFMLTGSVHDAEDLVQLTFIQAHKAIERFRGEAGFATWLHAIMINQFRNELRKRKRRIQRYIMRDDQEQDVPEQRYRSPYSQAAFREINDVTMGAMLSLPKKQREVMVLRTIENMGYREIADAVNCSVGTVKSRVHAARKRILKILKDMDLLPDHLQHKGA